MKTMIEESPAQRFEKRSNGPARFNGRFARSGNGNAKGARRRGFACAGH
jgi:hypothetical protein